MTGRRRGGARARFLACAVVIILGLCTATAAAGAVTPAGASGLARRPSIAAAGAVGGATDPGRAPTQEQPSDEPTTTVVTRTEPGAETTDARVGMIVVALVVVALLLTVCTVVYWRMTRPPAAGAQAGADSS